MRLVAFVLGTLLIASPVFAQTAGGLLQAPSPEPMMLSRAPAKAVPIQAGKQAQGQADAQLNRQVTAVQQRLQQEETRLQAQFTQLQKMRAAALEKQDQKELERINGLEKQVVADYQKRVEQVLVSAQTQIQATPIHVGGTPNQPTKDGRTQTTPTQTQRIKTQPTAATKGQDQQQNRKPTQSSQKSGRSGYWLFGRR